MPVFPNIQLISFDVDDTLWDFPIMQLRGNEAVARAIVERFGLDYAYMDAAYLIEKYREKVQQGIDPTQLKWVEVRRRLFAELLGEIGLQDAEALSFELAAVYTRGRNTEIPLYPGVLETLDVLRGRYKLGWVTNGNEIPALIGLDGTFDVVITPDRLGRAKPDPAVFEHVAAVTGVPLDAILHVGDSLNSDVGGAKGAGCKAVWFNPNGRDNDSEHVPDAEISTIPDVLALVNGA